MDESYASDRELADRYGKSRASIWRWPNSIGFPSPVKLSPGCTRWKMSEVLEWESRQPRYRSVKNGRLTR